MATGKDNETTTPWEVYIPPKIQRKISALPKEIEETAQALFMSIRFTGPVQPKARNYGLLKGKPKGEEWHHCHLNKKQKNKYPEYVVVWYADQDEKIVEICHADSHENTDYKRFRKK